MERHVALVGFMAAGKSSVGRRLASELGVPFVDTDARIVAQHGPIPDIFARDGEARFREYECAAIGEALAGPLAVLALGGGAVTHEPTRALLAERALRIFLDVPIEVIINRLRYAPATRPLLGPAPSETRVRALLDARMPLYREADVVIDYGRRSSSAVARYAAELLRSRGPLPAA